MQNQKQVVEVNKANFLGMAKMVGMNFAKAWAEEAGVTAAQIQLWVINYVNHK